MLARFEEGNATSLFTRNDKGSGVGDKPRGNWYCKIDDTVIGEFLIIPLTSRRKIKSESYRMNNCCRHYVEDCAGMDYTLFSIRSRTGERLATLGLRRFDGRWSFDQCFGPGNDDVLEETHCYLDENDELQTESSPTELYYIAQEVVRMMNSEQILHWQ